MHAPHTSQPLEFSDFKLSHNILAEIEKSNQGKYVLDYLTVLETKKVLIEPNYFDRDYLSEFSAFYSTSAHGYKNICKRVHFFSDSGIDREFFKKAVGGDKNSIRILNDHYLGFCVLRPIQARLGRTVLKWLENREQNSSRITVKRNYKCHIAGVTLEVEGLAWQQQDQGVGACATIALWSALQSSAFDDFHAIPTTVEITKAAHKTAPFGSRTFPSGGLTDFQLYEAIKELGLSPMVQSGEILLNNKMYFSKEQLMGSIASYIRSGYPVIILGDLIIDSKQAGQHAVCAVGFRDSTTLPDKPITLEDSSSDVLYIHDDNIGPSARFRIKTQKYNGINYSILHHEAPSYSSFQEDRSYQIIPTKLVVATHNEIRTSPAQLHFKGLGVVSALYNIINSGGGHPIKLSLSTRFIKLTDYVHSELGRLLASNSENLSQLRMACWEKMRPMSLHLGLVRIGLAQSSVPLVDILYDTTDSNLQMFDYIYFAKGIDDIIRAHKLASFF